MILKLYQFWNRFVLMHKKVQIGKNLCVRGKIYVHGKKHGVIIGDNCTIYSDESVNPTSGVSHSHFVVGENAILKIGNNVGMSHVNITAYESVTIENNVLIGSGVKIWDTDFHPIAYKARKEGIDGKSSPITIREGAFIGACSIILKGVTIGEHSVIGAGSVVTTDVPQGEVWAGNPARFIRKISD